jgi:DNA-binding PadR family transcriptional regulator
MTDLTPPVNREILLAFWKVHILHHAEGEPVYGLWLLHELAEHGYRLSPGTLYPILGRMERNGWLRSSQSGHVRSRREYRITAEGRRVLGVVRMFIAELHLEVVGDRKAIRRRRRSTRSQSS